MTALARVYSLAHDSWACETPYSESIVAQFRAAPGCVFDRGLKAWVGPPEAMKEALAVIERAQLAVISRTNEEPRQQGIGNLMVDGLYDYQVRGALEIMGGLAVRGAHLMADDMGLGKSAQALRALLLSTSKRLIVCPAVVIGHWCEEIKRWTSEIATRLGEKRKKKDGGGRVTDWEGYGVISYDTFRSLHKQIAHAGAVILDELHYLSSAKSLRSKAVRAYLAACPKRPLLVGLTGTPMTARPKDLWHPLDLLFPGRFGNFFNFGMRYCGGHSIEIPGLERSVWDFDGQSNLEELGRRLQSGLMTRRVKSEVLDLPARQRIMMPVELPEKARRGLAKATAILSSDKDVGRMLSEIEEHKIAAAIELAEDAMAQGHRPLLFTLRRETARKLGEALQCPYVTGEDDADDRQGKLDGAPCGVATVYSVTTGIDLVSFDTAIFVGLDWVPSTLLQAEARLHRIGQGSSTTFYYLVGMGTLDETVRSVVIERLENFATVVGAAREENELAGTLKGNASHEDIMGSILKKIREGLL